MNYSEKIPLSGERAKRALVNLRRALGITQQDLAVRLGKAVVTVARWETSRPPSGDALVELGKFAAENGQPDIAMEFHGAHHQELGLLGVPMTVEERIVHDALMDIMRNRQLPPVGEASQALFDALLSAHAKLMDARLEGHTLSMVTDDELEYAHDSLKAWRQAESRLAAETNPQRGE